MGNVSACDKSTGKSQKITITNDKGRLSKEDIEKMVNDAEKFKKDDEAAADRVRAKNELESYAYQVKQTMDDEKIKDKISDEDKKAVRDKADETISWLDSASSASKEEYESMKKELEAVCNPIMTKMYQAAGALQAVCQVVCQAVCQVELQAPEPVLPQVVALPLEDQPSKKSIKSLIRKILYNYFLKFHHNNFLG